MEIAAVYLKPIDMEPRGMGLPAAKSDIHLEADIQMCIRDRHCSSQLV